MIIFNVVLRSNSLRSQYLAIKNGLGLGLIHSFIASNDDFLELVLPDYINIKREYWINIHENSYQFKRIKAVAKFLVDIIKKKKFHFQNKLVFSYPNFTNFAGKPLIIRKV